MLNIDRRGVLELLAFVDCFSVFSLFFFLYPQPFRMLLLLIVVDSIDKSVDQGTENAITVASGCFTCKLSECLRRLAVHATLNET